MRIGGRYFDLIDTEYALRKLNAGTELRVTMRYRVSTAFNWYTQPIADFLVERRDADPERAMDEVELLLGAISRIGRAVGIDGDPRAGVANCSRENVRFTGSRAIAVSDDVDGAVRYGARGCTRQAHT